MGCDEAERGSQLLKSRRWIAANGSKSFAISSVAPRFKVARPERGASAYQVRRCQVERLTFRTAAGAALVRPAEDRDNRIHRPAKYLIAHSIHSRRGERTLFPAPSPPLRAADRMRLHQHKHRTA